MNPTASERRRFALLTLPGLVALVAVGCGTVQQETEEYPSTTPVSVTARLEYRIDSLMNENRRLRQQMESLATENRSLTARNAELETRVSGEAPPAPRPPGTTTTMRTPATKSMVASTEVMSTYEQAVADYRKRNFQAAIDQLQALLNSGIGEDLANNCRYWMGESYYGLKKYTDAVAQFETVVSSKLSAKKSDAQLMIGNSHAMAGNAAAAKEAFSKVVAEYPGSSAARSAQAKLNRMK